MVKAFQANRADQSFNVRRLPRRSKRDGDLLDAHVFHALLEFRSVDPITITKQISWCFIPWKRCDGERLAGLRWRRIDDPDGDSGPSMIAVIETVGHAQRFAKDAKDRGFNSSHLPDYGLHIYYNNKGSWRETQPQCRGLALDTPCQRRARARLYVAGHFLKPMIGWDAASSYRCRRN